MLPLTPCYFSDAHFFHNHYYRPWRCFPLIVVAITASSSRGYKPVYSQLPRNNSSYCYCQLTLFFPHHMALDQGGYKYHFILLIYKYSHSVSRAGSMKAHVVKYMFWEEIQDPPYWNSSMLITFPLLMEESFNGSSEMNPTRMKKLKNYLVNYPKVLLFL